MKCPKCGYLGFETTDRCRNCQYDFSLAPFSSEPELALHGKDRETESPNDFELPPIKRQSDKLSATALDLDRLFGDSEASPPEPPPALTSPPPAPPLPVRTLEPPAITDLDHLSPHEFETPIDDPGLSIPVVEEALPDITTPVDTAPAPMP